MPLPPNVKMTKLGRKVFDYLDQHPEATGPEIQKATGGGHDRVHHWKKLWRAHHDDPKEAPPPTVQRRVDPLDPTAIFSPAPPPKKKSQNPEPVSEPSATPSSSESAIKADGPEAPKPESDTHSKVRIRDVRL